MRKYLSIFICSLLSFSVWSQPTTPEALQRALDNTSFKQRFETANDLFYQKKYYHAQQIFLHMLKDQPDNAHINFKTGICLLNSNTERTKALPYLLKAEKGVAKNFDPISYNEENAPVETYYYLAQAYHLDYQFDKSIETLESFKDKISKKHILYPTAELLITQCNLAKKMVMDPDEEIIITNLGSTINSEHSDFSPILSLDGNALYFTSTRVRPDSSNLDEFNWNSGRHFEDIYVAYKNKDGEWGTPRVIDFSETTRNEATIGLSADGMNLFVYLDETGGGDIYYSEYSDTAFEYLELLGSDINTPAWETHATISPDGNTLYFVSDREGGLGGRDIYLSRKLPNGRWGLAVNVGAPINSEFDEDSPYFAPDGKTLYFSSNGPKSMGGFDIFVTKRNEDNTEWVTPVSLGYPINTVDDDVFFIIGADGVTGYYSSLHEIQSKNDGHGEYSGYGEKDIYEVRFEKQAIDRLAVLKGYIVPKKGEPIPSNFTIYATDLTTGEKSGPYVPRHDDGGYALILVPCHKYHVEYKMDGQLFSETEFEVPCESDIQTIHREIYLDPLALDSANRAAENVVRWRVIDSPVNLSGKSINYYDEDGKISGSVNINSDGVFEYQDNAHEYTYQFQIDDLSEIVCKSVCIAQVDNDDNILGYAIRSQMCEFVYEDQIRKWQLVDNQGNKVTNKNVRVIFKDEEGNISFEEKLGCNGMFAYHNLNPDNTMLFELGSAEASLCDEVEIVLLDKNNKVVGRSVRGEKCQFTYGDAGTTSTTTETSTPKSDIPPASFQRFYDYNQKDIDPNSADFLAFISEAKKMAEANGFVSIEISSSASKVPTTRFKTNENLARARANEAKQTVLEALKKQGVAVNKIRFTAMTTLVLGPNYRNDFDTNKSTYEKYQYVKLMAK